MSDAKVTFAFLGSADLPLAGEEETFSFVCPRRAGRRCEGLIIAGRTKLKHDPQGQNGGIAQWHWDGNAAAPTFSPSIDCGGCGWHGYIHAGRCKDANHNDEPEPV